MRVLGCGVVCWQSDRIATKSRRSKAFPSESKKNIQAQGVSAQEAQSSSCIHAEIAQHRHNFVASCARVANYFVAAEKETWAVNQLFAKIQSRAAPPRPPPAGNEKKLTGCSRSAGVRYRVGQNT